jgi:hypothetical protein
MRHYSWIRRRALRRIEKIENIAEMSFGIHAAL